MAINIVGKVVFDNNWYLLEIKENEDFTNLIKSKLADKYNDNFEMSDKFHISIIKNESPSLKQQKFGKSFVNEYINIPINLDDLIICDTNGRHMWLELENDRLCKMREFFGLPCVKINDQYRIKFHLTIAKFINPMNDLNDENKSSIARITQTCYFDLSTLYQYV
jgi:hypothetical protein